MLQFTKKPSDFTNKVKPFVKSLFYISEASDGKHEFLMNGKTCTTNFGATFIGVFVGDCKIQISYKSKKNTDEILQQKFNKLFCVQDQVNQPIIMNENKPTSEPKKIVVSKDQFVVENLDDYNWGFTKELISLGCVFDAVKQIFVCPISKQSNISEVVNHYRSNSKGLTKSQRIKRDKLITLISEDCEFKKDDKGLWIINVNDLETKTYLKQMCAKVGFRLVRTINGVRHLVK